MWVAGITLTPLMLAVVRRAGQPDPDTARY
jgi:hypothetical protein